MAAFKTGQNITRLPSPRVLVQLPSRLREDPEGLVARLEATVPTVRRIGYTDEVNLNEWDCIVTWETPATVEWESDDDAAYSYGREPKKEFFWETHLPPQLSVVCLVGRSSTIDILDVWPRSGRSENIPPATVLADHEVNGDHITHIDGLSAGLDALVRSDLVSAVRDRPRPHLTFRTVLDEEREKSPLEGTFELEPFLLGPDEQVLAGRYARSDEASVWLVPADVPEVFPWVCEALRDWHDRYPKRFPVLPDWHHTSRWYSNLELEISDRRTTLDAEFDLVRTEYDTNVGAIEVELTEAKRLADEYERALVTADGKPLEQAVGRALTELGFVVQDMDLVHPDGDKREDFRVTDPAAPDWIVIAEVKGSKGGARETELMNVGRWVERFAAEQSQLPDARWFIANHDRRIDPDSRTDPFVNKPDVPAQFNKSSGTILDTRALFDLLTLATDDSSRAAARAMLKAALPMIGRVTAKDLDGFRP